MPRVIAEFSERRLVRSKSCSDTMLYLEKKGQINAMGEQQWVHLAQCAEYPDRNEGGDDGDLHCLMRAMSAMVPRTAEDK